MGSKYISIHDLEVYKLSRDLSRIGWGVYNSFNWHTQKIIGDQFIQSTDSVGANIAEGYGRFHYLDKIKFYYNSRGSLLEASEHWSELLHERGLVSQLEYTQFKEIAKSLLYKLNNFISRTYQSKSNFT